jgi:hypothetical protein
MRITLRASVFRAFAERTSQVAYPFGSELYTDQTGQPQVYEAFRR